MEIPTELKAQWYKLHIEVCGRHANGLQKVICYNLLDVQLLGQ